MSKIVKKIPPSPSAQKYPWDTWFDGETHELSRGTDFHPEPSTFCITARKAAKKRKLEVTIAVRGEKVYIQSLGKKAKPSLKGAAAK